MKSFDQDQLQGTFRSNDSISNSDCDPLKTDPETGKAYYPCGLIANSIFNDTINSPVWIEVAGSDQDNQTYSMTSQGTAWSSDRDLYKPTAYTEDDVVPPPNWRVQYPTYNATFPLPNLQEWDAFQIWMRTAGLPTFSKLSLRNDSAPMRGGWYYVDVNDCKPIMSELVTQCLPCDRFPGVHLWRNKVNPHLNQNGNWREESVLGHCICCGRGNLRPTGSSFHSNTSHKA